MGKMRYGMRKYLTPNLQKVEVDSGIEFNHQLLPLTASFSAKEKIAYAEKYISMWLPPNCKMSILLAV